MVDYEVHYFEDGTRQVDYLMTRDEAMRHAQRVQGMNTRVQLYRSPLDVDEDAECIWDSSNN